MCGISGFTHQGDRQGSKYILASMLEAIQYRGPDSTSGLVGNNYALGNVRLSIVDLIGGIQPAVSDDKKIAVVFNGEIFNYKLLREDLISQGIKFNSASEVETLLHLYIKHGFDFIKRKLIDPSIKYKWTESLEQATNAIYYDRKSKATRRPKKNNPDYIVQEEVLDSSSSEKVASST